MQSKVLSQVLAVFLCLGLLVGFMPAALAAEGDDDVTVTFDQKSVTLTEGDSESLDYTITGDDTASASLKSSDTSVATVSGNKVTAVSAGTATITVTVGDSSDTCTVTVKAKEVAVSISVAPKTLSLDVNGTKTGTLTATVTGASAADVTWASDATGVATVSGSGNTATVTAQSTGTATITAVIIVNGVPYSANCTVTVSDSDKPSLNSNSARITVKNKTTLKVNNAPAGSKVTWTSSNDTIASVTSAGVVTGVRAGSATITATVKDGTTIIATLECKVTVETESTSGGSSVANVTYTVASNGSVTFRHADFDTQVKKLNGENVNYIEFSLPSSSSGVLYYDYSSSSKSNEKVEKNQSYYRTGNTSSKPTISNVTFVPASGKTGTVDISYTGEDAGGNSISGKIRITIDDDDTIRYSTAKNQEVKFVANHFNNYCKNDTGNNLDYIRFDSLPSSNRGTLYYNYTSASKNDGEVSRNTSYYRTGSGNTNLIANITFVPYNNWTGTVSIDFTGRDDNNKSISGTIDISVGTGGSTITYTASVNKPVTMVTSDFNTLIKDDTGYNLDYVKFTLPSNGTLYYNYTNSGSYDSKVSASTEYNRNSNPRLENVTFVPNSNYTGTVTIKFDAWDTDGTKFSGEVRITYSGSGNNNASTINYSSTGGPVSFNSNDFVNACSSRNGGSLSSVKFNLPSTSQGVLYSGYTSDTNYDGLVSQSTSYSTGNGTGSISNVTFVPASGYVGTVNLTYTGTDNNDDTFTGTISIAITQAIGFTDMGNYSWASAEVDYLLKKGIVTGTSNNTYNPSGNITRGDFVLMLYRAYNLSAPSTNGNFSDVTTDMYYYEAIAVAKELGIAQGGASGTFNPKSSLTREDAMVLLYRTLEVAGIQFEDISTSGLDAFSDGSSIASYARESVAALVQIGAVKGDNNNRFNPKNALTRAEMAVVLYRVLNM